MFSKINKIQKIFEKYNIGLKNLGYCWRYHVDNKEYSLYLDEDQKEDMVRINAMKIKLSVLQELLSSTRLHNYFIQQ